MLFEADKDKAVEAAKKLQNGLIAPFVSAKLSTLGGIQKASIMLAVSLDKPDTWNYGIFENSRYFRMSVEIDGTLENISGSSRTVKFRKRKVKTLDEAIAKINAYIQELGKHPDNK